MSDRHRDKNGAEISVGDMVRLVTEFKVQLLQDRGGDSLDILHHDGSQLRTIRCDQVERVPTAEEISEAETEMFAAEEAAD